MRLNSWRPPLAWPCDPRARGLRAPAAACCLRPADQFLTKGGGRGTLEKVTHQKRPPSASADAAKASERLRVPSQSALERIAKALELGRRGRRVRQMARRAESQGSE